MAQFLGPNFSVLLAGHLGAVVGPAPWVTLLADTQTTEPIHPHWWSGWSWARIKEWAIDDVWSDSTDIEDWGSEPQLVGHKLSPGPLSALLRPQRRVCALIPIGVPLQPQEVRTEGQRIVFTGLKFEEVPGGVITHARIAKEDGTPLADVQLTRPVITSPGGKDTVEMTDFSIDFS